MIERRRIVEMWRAGRADTLATLVRVEGSSYRREGARLLMGSDGSYSGSISGGCLEAEIVRKARWLTRSGAVVERYSTLFDDTAEIPFGLGCGGAVEVLIEPIATPEGTAMMQALADSLIGEALEVTSCLPGHGRPLRRHIELALHGTEKVNSARPGAAEEGVFREILEPPQRLFVIGAGADAQPMVRMASLLGWSVFVLEGRSQWARAERFPEAEQVRATNSFGSLLPGRKDAVVLMTHSYEADRDWLQQVLPCRPRYLGLLGSRHRSALLVTDAARLLGWELDRACEQLFSPVGLDLGGDGAEAIALSAIAEVQSCIQGKLGQSRRLTPETVREQAGRGGAPRLAVARCAL